MTFSYDTRCRKEGIIQNRYIIQPIYTYDLNGGLPGKIVCPHIVLSSDCPIIDLYSQHLNMWLYPFNFSTYGVVPL